MPFWRVAYSGDTYLFRVWLGLIYCKNSTFYRMVCQLSSLRKLLVGMVITCARLTVWVCTLYIFSSALCHYVTFQWWLALYAGRCWLTSTLLASHVNLHMGIHGEFKQMTTKGQTHPQYSNSPFCQFYLDTGIKSRLEKMSYGAHRGKMAGHFFHFFSKCPARRSWLSRALVYHQMGWDVLNLVP